MNIVNLVLILLETILLFVLTYKIYKKYKITGLYFLVILLISISNIFLIKRFEIFTLKLNTGIILNLMIYIISNIIVQKKGPYAVSNIIMIVFITTLFNYVILTISGIINPSSYNEHFNMLYNNIFEFNIRSYLASLTSLLIGLTLSSKLYYVVKKEINKVWISNILTTIIVQLIEAIVFIFLMYIFELKISEIIFLIISRYIFRLFIGLLSNILQVKLSKLD